jgi:hypothetical protein
MMSRHGYCMRLLRCLRGHWSRSRGAKQQRYYCLGNPVFEALWRPAPFTHQQPEDLWTTDNPENICRLFDRDISFERALPCKSIHQLTQAIQLLAVALAPYGG